jgi:iron complex outermembrane receptor protein
VAFRVFKPATLSLVVAGAFPAVAAEPLAPAPVEPTQLETVEVKASRGRDSTDARRDDATGKIVIDSRELEKHDAVTVGELLRKLPGVSLAPPQEGGRRGPRREDRLTPRILVDGEPLPGGNGLALRLPAELIERIEIIKTSTAEYPAGAGGTINLVLRDIPPKKAGTARIGLATDGDALGGRLGGSWGDREGNTGMIWMGFVERRLQNGSRDIEEQTFTGNVRSDWDLEFDETSGHEDALLLIPRITRDLGEGGRLVISPFLRYSEQDRYTHTDKFTYSDPVNGTGLVGDGSEDARARQQNATGRLSLEWKKRQKGSLESSLRLSLQGQNQDQSTRQDAYDSSGALLTRTDTQDRRYALSARLAGKHGMVLGDDHLVTFGLEGQIGSVRDRRSETVNGTPSTLGAQAAADSTAHLLALWAQDEWQLADAHRLTPGLRVQVGQNRVTDASGLTITDRNVAWLPSLHYLWQANPSWNFRSSVALSERPPSINDLSPVIRTATGTNSVSNPDQAGNPALEPEQTLTLQLGVEHFLAEKRGSGGINLFLRQIDDKIVQITTLENGRYVERPYNVAQAREASLVADYKWKPRALQALSLNANLSLSFLRIDDPGSAFDRQESPRRAANLGAEYDWQAHKLQLGGAISYASEFTLAASPALRQSLGGNTQLNVYVVKKLDKSVNLRFSVDNLTAAGRNSTAEVYENGALTRLEEDHASGRRLYNLSLEGKW